MGIFDALTGDAGHAAANNQRQLLATLVPQMGDVGKSGYNNAGDALRTGFGGAGDWLQQGYGEGTRAVNTGFTDALGYLDQGQQGALGQLGQARGDLTANGGAFAPLSALAGRYGAGAGLYADSLGINGAEGNTRAQGAFDAGPAYQWQRDQGIEALARKANASGQLVGGNADRDAMDYASNLAKTSYGSWQDRLKDYNGLELQATSGAAVGNQGINTSLANLGVAGAGLMDSGGRARAGVATGQGNSLADIANRYFGGQAGLDTAEGGALAQNYIGGAQNYQGIYRNAIPQWNDTYKQDAAVSNAASANSLKLGLEGLKLAAGAAAGMGGMPGGLPSNGTNFAGLGGWA